VGLVDDAWDRQRRWSVLADGLQTSRVRCGRLNLVLLATGALAGALAAQESWLPRGARLGAGVVAAAVLAIAAVVQQQFLGPERSGRWPLARTTSEEIKAAVFQRLVGVDADPDAALRDRMREAERRADTLLLDLAQVRIDPEAPPAVAGLDDYVVLRAQDQERWHRAKVAPHARTAKRLHNLELAATLVATVLAAVASTVDVPALSAWVAAATTVAAAITAHVLGGQHARIARSYLNTAGQLRELIEGVEADGALTPAFVTDVETVLSAQNQGWVSLLTPR
jgi:hypothetical protein